MLTLENVVGNQEDWANFITNVEMMETPFLDWLPVGDKPVNVIYQYQADAYEAPMENRHVDGKPWTSFRDAGENRGSMKALIQWFDKTTAVSKLSQDVTNAAGVADELARDIPIRLKEMARDMEAAFLENNDCLEDNKVVGYRTRAVGSWINASAQALYPVPAAFRPPSASVITTGTGSVTEDSFRDVLLSMASVTKSKEPVTAFVGPYTKRKFTDFPLFSPSTTATGINLAKAEYGRTWERNVERYTTDFGPVDIMLSWYNNVLDGNSTTQNYSSYFLHRTRWQVRWNQKPKVYRPEFKGGSYEAAMDAILMLVCNNPKGEGSWTPTGA